MQQQAKQHSLGLVEKPIPQLLLRMTTPMIVGMAMLFSFGLIDTLFISFLGTHALTAISFTFPVTFTVISMAIGLGIGTSAVVAKYLGSSAFDKAREACTVTTYIGVLLAVILAFICYLIMDRLFLLMGASHSLLPTIREYMVIWLPGSVLMVAIQTGISCLRAYGDIKTSSIIMAGSGLINAILDPIFIFGFGPIPAMGVGGTALATLIAWAAGFAYLMYLLIFKLDLVSKKIPNRSVLVSSSREMLRIGLPAAGANMMTPLAAGIMTAIAAGFGEPAVAAFGVGSRIEPIAILIILAMSSTLPPLISQNFGAGRIDRVSEAYRIATRFIMAWQLLVYLILAVGSAFIAGVFTKDPEVREVITLYILILPLSYGLQGVIILTNSALNALHRPMEALYLSAARFFLFYVPLAWIGSLYFGLVGFFTGALLGNAVMTLISLRAFKNALAAEQKTLRNANPA